MKTKKGFSLIEILVTLSVIVIIAAIFLVTLHPQRQRAQNASVRATVHSASTAATVCSIEHAAISDPAISVGNPICTNSPVWPDLTQSDANASWGGCAPTQNPAEGSFRFCATLGDTSIVMCTQTGCK